MQGVTVSLSDSGADAASPTAQEIARVAARLFASAGTELAKPQADGSAGERRVRSSHAA